MTTDPSEKSAEILPIDVTLEICAESIARRNPCEPKISPVPVKARAELLADLLSAAESIERHCQVSAELGQLYTATLSGAQILALRLAIANAK